MVYVTAARAYLDVGAADGLAPGAVVVARRGGAEAGRCTVDELGSTTPRARRRRSVRATRSPSARPPSPLRPRRCRRSPPPEELAVRARAAAEAPVVAVDFRPTQRREAAAATGGGSSSRASST